MPEPSVLPIKFDSSGLIIQTNVSLKQKNWFRTGGNADFFCQPKNPLQFQHALTFAQQQKLPLFVLGEGANVLISDNGFAGLVIQPQLNNIEVISQDNKNVLIKAGAGARMHDVIEYCLKKNILGLEEFSGIPGTVGGSVYINIHYFNFLLDQFLIEADIIDKKTGCTKTVDREWFHFGYNQSRLHESAHFLLNATFSLKPSGAYETAYACGRHFEIIRQRTQRYPSSGTCGSFFRNFHDNEVDLVVNNKKMIYIAYYLDKIGVKGNLRVGDAIVSYQHANMIVNCGNATTNDIVQLVRTMQKLVKKNFGVIPQPECLLVGFDSYPLF